MNSQWQNKALFFFVTLVAFIDGILVATHFHETEATTSIAQQINPMTDVFTQNSEAPEQPTSQKPAPAFTSQAPLGTWDLPWSDYAEEACVYMALKAFSGEALPARNVVAEDLRNIGKWEKEAFGSSKLTDAAQTLKIIQDYGQHSNASLSYEISEKALKAALDDGALLILPVNGQIVDNPYYGDPAPEHHMILVYAYTETGFLTNDPGTMRGAATEYSIQKILDSIQDLNGERVVIRVNP